MEKPSERHKVFRYGWVVVKMMSGDVQGPKALVKGTTTVAYESRVEELMAMIGAVSRNIRGPYKLAMNAATVTHNCRTFTRSFTLEIT